MKFLIFCILLTTCIQSQPILNNVNYMSLGYDLKIGQPTINALCNQIFDLTYNLNKTVYIQNTNYLVPDNLQVIDYPYESLKATTRIYQSEYILQQGITQTYSYEENSIFMLGMYSESYISEFFKQNKDTDQSYTATTNIDYTVYKAEYSTLNLTQEFQQDLFSLPNEYDASNCHKFNAFFKKYGTDFVWIGVFGGSEFSITSFSENLFSYYNETEIIEQINNQFLFWSSSENLNYWQKEYYHKLNMYFNSEFELVGGYPYLFNKSDINDWLSSIIEQPVLVSMSLKSLAYLLPENETEKINALSLARKNYFYDYYFEFGQINDAPQDLFFNWPKNYVSVGSSENIKMYFMADNNYMYDPKLNYWYTFDRGPLIGLVNYTCTNTSINNNIYCFGGNNIDQFISYYDTDNNLWTILNPPVYMCVYTGPYDYRNCTIFDNIKSAIGSEFTGLINGISANIKDYIYLYGFILSNNYYIQSEPYDGLISYDIINNIIYLDGFFLYLNDTWIDYHGVMFQAAIPVQDAVFLFNPVNCGLYNDYVPGCVPHGNYDNYTNHVFVHYYGSDVIIKLTETPETLVDFAITNDGNSIYIVGGYNPILNTYNENIYKYDVIDSVWSTKSTNVILGLGMAFIVDEFMYYFSGSNGVYPYIKNEVKFTSLIEPCKKI